MPDDRDRASPSVPPPSVELVEVDVQLDEPPTEHDRFAPPVEREGAIRLEAPPPPPRPAPVATPVSAPDRAVAEAPVERGPRALADRPALRMLIGVALGLGVGYIVSTPYARRAEKAIAAIRAEADAVRYMNEAKVRARAAVLDGEAADRSSNAALATVALWLASAALVAFGWRYATRARR